MLSEMGYGALALTPDVGHLDLYHATEAEIAGVAKLAMDLDMRIVVETGARFLMDSRRKHFPTLLETSPFDRERRVDFLKRSCDLAVALGSDMVSIWSGQAPGELKGADRAEDHWENLCEGLRAVLAHVQGAGISLALEPEPGMFIERPREYSELLERMGAEGKELWMTLDVGHLVVTGDLPVEVLISDFAHRIRNVHLDDCPRGVHQHGPFGSGDLDLDATLNAFITAGYEGVASVELSRDSHQGAAAAEQAMCDLQRILKKHS
ncbi:MAG: sugar phosphate isomerase/epimerase [Planctomycetota bacterium]|jgi:sugar phosphate isomerase/epimerase